MSVAEMENENVVSNATPLSGETRYERIVGDETIVVKPYTLPYTVSGALMYRDLKVSW